MQDTNPSRKRAGTSTYATSQHPARKMRLVDPPSRMVSRETRLSYLNTQSPTHPTRSNATTINPIPGRPSRTPEYTTPPTPCSSPEPYQSFNSEDNLDYFGFPIHTKSLPFPNRPRQSRLHKNNSEPSIPEEPAEIDKQVGSSATGQPYIYPLQTPPRSHPTLPATFSHSPPSKSYGSTSAASSSGLPSLSSSETSPLSPRTPSTPLSRFNSAVSNLKLVLMADDLGMSLQDLDELNRFAAPDIYTSISGSSKRDGRVLIRKDIQQRREKNDISVAQDPRHRRTECQLETCAVHTTPNMFRDVEWSCFSDTSDEDMVCVGMDIDMDVEVNMGCDGVAESLVERCMRMSIDVDGDGDDATDRKDKAILETAEVVRRMKPATLRVRNWVEGVGSAVGPMGERL